MRQLKTFMKAKKPMWNCGECKCVTLQCWRNNDEYCGCGGTPVPPGPVIPIEEIWFDSQTFFVKKGQTKDLPYHIYPDNATEKITWTSSNTSVARVRKGKVTGVNDGTATITASAHGVEMATISVTVSSADVTYVGISGMEPGQGIGINANRSDGYGIQVTPYNAPNNHVTITVTNPNAVTVSDPYYYPEPHEGGVGAFDIRGLSAGEETDLIIASEADPNVSSTYHVYVTQDIPVSTIDNVSASDIYVYNNAMGYQVPTGVYVDYSPLDAVRPNEDIVVQRKEGELELGWANVTKVYDGRAEIYFYVDPATPYVNQSAIYEVFAVNDPSNKYEVTVHVGQGITSVEGFNTDQIYVDGGQTDTSKTFTYSPTNADIDSLWLYSDTNEPNSTRSIVKDNDGGAHLEITGIRQGFTPYRLQPKGTKWGWTYDFGVECTYTPQGFHVHGYDGGTISRAEGTYAYLYIAALPDGAYDGIDFTADNDHVTVVAIGNADNTDGTYHYTKYLRVYFSTEGTTNLTIYSTQDPNVTYTVTLETTPYVPVESITNLNDIPSSITIYEDNSWSDPIEIDWYPSNASNPRNEITLDAADPNNDPFSYGWFQPGNVIRVRSGGTVGSADYYLNINGTLQKQITITSEASVYPTEITNLASVPSQINLVSDGTRDTVNLDILPSNANSRDNIGLEYVSGGDGDAVYYAPSRPSGGVLSFDVYTYYEGTYEYSLTLDNVEQKRITIVATAPVPQTTPISSLSNLSASSVTVAAGDMNSSITIDYLPVDADDDTNVEFRAVDDTIADASFVGTVQAGTATIGVSGLAEGSTRINIYLDNVDTGLYIDVTVTAAPQTNPITSVSNLSANSVSIVEGQQDSTITFDYLPVDANDDSTVTFVYSDDTVTSADITGGGTGTAQLTIDGLAVGTSRISIYVGGVDSGLYIDVTVTAAANNTPEYENAPEL